MAKRNPIGPPVFKSRDLTAEQIDAGIRRIRKRIQEVDGLRTAKVSYDGQERENVESNIKSSIAETFGEESREYDEHRYHSIWHGGHNAYDEDYERQRKFEDGIPHTITLLNGLIARLEEKREESGLDPKTTAMTSLQNRDLHPRIYEVAVPIFRDGHYQSSVFEAAKALVNMVKEKSGRSDLDGVGLMSDVFSRNKPVLAFNNLSNKTELDEQEGMMHLFMGCVLAIRNPRGHDSPDDTADGAIAYLSLLSLLANKLEEARLVARSK